MQQRQRGVVVLMTHPCHLFHDPLILILGLVLGLFLSQHPDHLHITNRVLI